MNEAPSPLPDVEAQRIARGRRISALAGVFILLLYAGFFRWLFGSAPLRNTGGVVSLSFIWGVPFAVGFLSVAWGRWMRSDRWFFNAFIGPTCILTIALLVCLVTRIEAAICVLMAIPILYPAAFVGGAIAHWLLPRTGRGGRLQVTFAVFLPLIAAYAESTLHWPTELKAIENTILIKAPAEAIWPEIASVRPIPRAQITARWIYLIGFPKPISATLDHPGLGGIRTAIFERDVAFLETVTAWQPPRRLSFTIHADPNFIPHTAFDQHIIVGGRFYDVLDGRYDIEPLAPQLCRLHLVSHHRLGTRFNAYAGWWSEKIMDQIQSSILAVIRTRAEAAARPVAEKIPRVAAL